MTVLDAPAIQMPNLKTNKQTRKHTQCLPEHVTAFEPESFFMGTVFLEANRQPSLFTELNLLLSPFGNVRDHIQVVKNSQRPSKKWGSKILKMCGQTL